MIDQDQYKDRIRAAVGRFYERVDVEEEKARIVDEISRARRARARKEQERKTCPYEMTEQKELARWLRQQELIFFDR